MKSSLFSMKVLLSLALAPTIMLNDAYSKMEPPMKTNQNLTPPTAKVLKKTTNFNGDERVDPYFWLREKNNPEVIQYLKDENTYTEAVMADTKDLQNQLFEEMKGRIKENDQTVPFQLGQYFYFSRTFQGKQYPCYYRQGLGPNANEQVTIDLNEL